MKPADLNKDIMNEANKIDVVILCGGLGTRLRSVVQDRPKPMALINGKPFLEYLVDHIASFGFRRFVFCVGYKGHVVKEHFTQYKNISSAFSEEEELLGTGGALKLCEPHLHSRDVLVVNGDSMCAFNYLSFAKYHETKGGVATIAVAHVQNRTDGGYVSLDNDGRVLSFIKEHDMTKAYIDAGVYIFNRDVISDLPCNYKCSLSNDLLPTLLDRNVYGFATDCKLYDIGTPERLLNFGEELHKN